MGDEDRQIDGDISGGEFAGMKMIIITGPAIRADKTVSGISTIIKMLMDGDEHGRYVHFEVGRRDCQKKGPWRVARNLKGLWRWQRLLKSIPDAMVHYNFPMARMAVLRDPFYIWMAKRYGRRVLLHMHGGDLLRDENVGMVYRWLLRWTFRHCDRIIGPSITESRILEERYGAKEVIPLPNSINTEIAERYERDYEEQKGRTLRFGYLGRIERPKGMEEMLMAFSKLRSLEVPFELHIAGSEVNEDEFVPRFKEELNGRFVYHGVLNNEKKYELLKLMDVFVMPTHYDGLSMSLQECMSMGVVPVVTPVGPLTELMVPLHGSNSEEANGIFVDKGNANDIVSAVKMLNENRELLTVLGKNARKTILQKFSSNEYIKRLNKINSSNDKIID